MLNTKESVLLGQDIYLYKSFISIEESENLFNIAKNTDDSFWNRQTDYQGNLTHYSTGWFKEAEFIYNKMLNMPLVAGDLILDSSVYLQKYHNGQGMGINYDNNKVEKQIENAKLYKNGDRFELIKQPIYGIVVYLNSVEGGELYYESQNIIYRPSPGDMVIHSAEKHCAHGVKPLKSDIRIVFPTMIYKEIKVPVLVN